MLRPVYITRFLSGLMLLVFTFSITPKRFLHDVFAKHIDSKQAKTNDAPYQLGSSGFNCDTDNLVAESNYLIDLHTFSFPVIISYPSFNTREISFSSTFKIYSDLRGPPQVTI